MHIYLLLFLTFLEIGAFTFGGGHAMISLIREKALMYEWMTNEELLNFIAFAESSPGPIAINMATFVGSSQAGLIGAIIATVAVVLPSFLMILLIAAVIKNLLKNNYVKSFILLEVNGCSLHPKSYNICTLRSIYYCCNNASTKQLKRC